MDTNTKLTGWTYVSYVEDTLRTDIISCASTLYFKAAAANHLEAHRNQLVIDLGLVLRTLKNIYEEPTNANIAHRALRKAYLMLKGIDDDPALPWFSTEAGKGRYSLLELINELYLRHEDS